MRTGKLPGPATIAPKRFAFPVGIGDFLEWYDLTEGAVFLAGVTNHNPRCPIEPVLHIFELEEIIKKRNPSSIISWFSKWIYITAGPYYLFTETDIFWLSTLYRAYIEPDVFLLEEGTDRNGPREISRAVFPEYVQWEKWPLRKEICTELTLRNIAYSILS